MLLSRRREWIERNPCLESIFRAPSLISCKSHQSIDEYQYSRKVEEILEGLCGMVLGGEVLFSLASFT